MSRAMARTTFKTPRKVKVPRRLTQGPEQLGPLADWVDRHSTRLELGPIDPELDRQITHRLTKPRYE
ncbi:MAG: hypothetical protein KatS3mg071_2763 [Meiothermus sp.]|nr:MAG: hypothetical protein KatS3mg071_2763 [Meiothermus sp.]